MARLSKTINLDDPATGRTATVRELTPAVVRNANAQIQKDGIKFLADALVGDFTALGALLGDCVELSEAVGGLDGLSFSEVDAIKDAFLEINSSFFARAAIQDMVAALGLSLKISTEPAASLSDTDTPT